MHVLVSVAVLVAGRVGSLASAPGVGAAILVVQACATALALAFTIALMLQRPPNPHAASEVPDDGPEGASGALIDGRISEAGDLIRSPLSGEWCVGYVVVLTPLTYLPRRSTRIASLGLFRLVEPSGDETIVTDAVPILSLEFGLHRRRYVACTGEQRDRALALLPVEHIVSAELQQVEIEVRESLLMKGDAVTVSGEIGGSGSGYRSAGSEGRPLKPGAKVYAGSAADRAWMWRFHLGFSLASVVIILTTAILCVIAVPQP